MTAAAKVDALVADGLRALDQQAAWTRVSEFLAALPQQALNAYEDRCAPASPRMPMLDAYYG